MPWILEHRTISDNPALCCYSLSSDKIHTITCPRSCSKCFLGPSYHYLLAYRVTKVGCSWSLLNPLTSGEVHLPSLEEDMTYWVEWIGSGTGSGESAVFSMVNTSSRYSSKMILWQLGDHDTIQFRLEGICGRNGKLYYNGEFFFIDITTGVTKVMNITTQKLVYELPPIDRWHYRLNFWMVKSGGEILQVCSLCLDPENVQFTIYQLDLESGKGRACWVRVDSIGNHVLFLDKHRGVSFCASDYKGLGENCIYFLGKDFFYKYDIKDGAAESLHCPFVGKDRTWFAPRLYQFCPSI